MTWASGEGEHVTEALAVPGTEGQVGALATSGWPRDRAGGVELQDEPDERGEVCGDAVRQREDSVSVLPQGASAAASSARASPVFRDI
jgi:hypothetical protein